MPPLHLICFTSLIFFQIFGISATPKLNIEEVKALKEIGKKVGKKDWDFSTDPCSGEGNWVKRDERKEFESSVFCDCSFNLNSSCHIVRIELKSQNLSGTLPPEFSKLRHLKTLDLSRNYFNGTIPKQWASMRLEDVSFMGNHLSGPFPKVITSITTLKNLSLEGNRFNGPIPPEIGKLARLERLHLLSNVFSGELPSELGKLKNLTDLRISDNNFSGRIPDFIGNWSQIQKLQMQGCGLEGPIPSSISVLTNLTDLRISDLKGKESSFPMLMNLESLKNMILRRCLIGGKIPEYVADMKTLKHLDLSFNRLTGEIPASFVKLKKTNIIYLTGNKLTGSVPAEIIQKNKILDISYNNFSLESTTPTECQQGSVNLVESYFSTNKSSKHNSCLLRSFPCSLPTIQHRYSLYINCGGPEKSMNRKEVYEADTETRGTATYYVSPSQHWAFSSTGNFMDNDQDIETYIVNNMSKLANMSSQSSELYRSARVSALSLTYYGICLGNGNYTARLHFAEIISSDERIFNNLGRRVFDVYIQDKLVLKDFNIKDAAGGVGKPVIRTFLVNINRNTLKIGFYWAGKGTTGIPIRGTYGPLISAISVDPNFRPPKHKKNIVIEAGVGAGALLLVFLALAILWKKCCYVGKEPLDKGVYADIWIWINFRADRIGSSNWNIHSKTDKSCNEEL